MENDPAGHNEQSASDNHTAPAPKPTNKDQVRHGEPAGPFKQIVLENQPGDTYAASCFRVAFASLRIFVATLHRIDEEGGLCLVKQLRLFLSFSFFSCLMKCKVALPAVRVQCLHFECTHASAVTRARGQACIRTSTSTLTQTQTAPAQAPAQRHTGTQCHTLESSWKGRYRA